MVRLVFRSDVKSNYCMSGNYSEIKSHKFKFSLTPCLTSVLFVCLCYSGTISKPPECPFNLEIVTAESHRAEITPTV